MTATNTDGLTSLASLPSNPVLITGPPPSPHSVSAVAGDHQATVNFIGVGHPDGTANGLPITGYTVTSSPDATHPQGVSVHTPADAGSPATVTGLTNGVAYTFTVTEENADGPSAPSAPSNSVTPFEAPATATLSASSLDFGGQPLGTATQHELITFTNNGDVPLNFQGLSTGGANPDDFIGDTGTCFATLAPHVVSAGSELQAHASRGPLGHPERMG